MQENISGTKWDVHTFSNAKCGDIICQTEQDFVIVCTFCEMRTIEYDQFLLHFKNVHISGAFKNENVLAVSVKEENTTDHIEQTSKTKGTDIGKCRSSTTATEGHLQSLEEQFICGIESSNYCDETTGIQSVEGAPVQVFVQSKVPANIDADSCGVCPLEVLENCSAEEAAIKVKRFKSHTCEHCDRRFRTQRQLQHHINLQHLETKTVKCDRCEEQFVGDRLLQNHIRKVHTGFPCPQCDKVYKSSETLKVHSYSHKEVKDFICDFENCGKAFVSRKRLTIHKRTHTGTRNYICEICGYRTRVKDSLKIHMRIHTGEKPYVCQECNKRFISSSMLNEHKAVHSKERPHKCEVCDATFSARKALYHHSHLHLGIKKFKCRICGNAYAQAAGLSGHMRSHKKDGLF